MIGTKILEETTSPINGNLRVVKDLAWGVHIQVNGLTQSGGVVETIWRTTLRNLRTKEIKNCLILGLGGGTAAKLVRKFWPKAGIVGVDIDPVIAEMGKKYLGLEDVKAKIIIADALDFLKYRFGNTNPIPNRYDLVLGDLYIGDDIPEKFKSNEFLKLIPKLLTDNGVAVFNRLYFRDKRSDSVKFGNKLEKFFPKVEVFYPEANLMFFCSA